MEYLLKLLATTEARSSSLVICMDGGVEYLGREEVWSTWREGTLHDRRHLGPWHETPLKKRLWYSFPYLKCEKRVLNVERRDRLECMRMDNLDAAKSRRAIFY